MILEFLELIVKFFVIVFTFNIQINAAKICLSKPLLTFFAELLHELLQFRVPNLLNFTILVFMKEIAALPETFSWGREASVSVAHF